MQTSRFGSWQLCCLALCSIWLCGCAFNIISIRQYPAHFEAATNTQAAWTLDGSTKIRLKEGYVSELRAGTTWRQVGRVEQGSVFHTTDQIVIVEASHEHEVDIVVQDDRIVGFFLRVEHTFTPADIPVAIKTTPR